MPRHGCIREGYTWTTTTRPAYGGLETRGKSTAFNVESTQGCAAIAPYRSSRYTLLHPPCNNGTGGHRVWCLKTAAVGSTFTSQRKPIHAPSPAPTEHAAARRSSATTPGTLSPSFIVVDGRTTRHPRGGSNSRSTPNTSGVPPLARKTLCWRRFSSPWRHNPYQLRFPVGRDLSQGVRRVV